MNQHPQVALDDLGSLCLRAPRLAANLAELVEHLPAAGLHRSRQRRVKLADLTRDFAQQFLHLRLGRNKSPLQARRQVAFRQARVQPSLTIFQQVGKRKFVLLEQALHLALH